MYKDVAIHGKKIHALLTKCFLYKYECPANEVSVRIQYKCLVPIYVFPEMKLCSLLISKTEL